MAKVLFVSHSATRTGAPLLLLNFLRWYKNQGHTDFAIVLVEGGELEGEFRAIAETVVWTPPALPGEDVLSRIKERARRGRAKRRVLAAIRRHRPDLVYASSIASCAFLVDTLPAMPSGTRYVLHVHEGEFVIRTYCDVGAFHAMKDRITRIVAASRATTENLVARHGIDADRTSVIYEHLDVAGVVSGAAVASRKAIRHELAIPADAFVVGGCGLVQIRKGIDAFLATKVVLDHLRPGNHTHFVWVGHLDHYHRELMRLDLERANLAKTVHFTGERAEPFAYFDAFDVFYLPSREDPFPVACLEAAALGKPIIAFQEAGGMPEFIGADAGTVVPYLDCMEAARAIARYVDEPDLRARHGGRAREKANDYDIRVIGPRIVSIIDAVRGASR